MKAVILVCFLGTLAMALARPNATYDDKYDNVDLDEVINNRRLLVAYVDCLTEKGKCAPDAKELAVHIPDALMNDCGKCNKTQKDGTEKVIKHLVNKEPALWEALLDKYDPERMFSKKHEERLTEIKGKQ